MNHDATPTITPKASARASAPETAAVKTKAPGGLWPFLRTLFIGSAGLAVLAVIATLAGSAWLTANQRAEADKPQPWADPSFTTTAVTTGGMLARFMDNDGNLDNGHSYIKGIYDLWKVKQQAVWISVFEDEQRLVVLPQLWQIEMTSDAKHIANLSLARSRATAAATNAHVLQERAKSARSIFDALASKPSISADLEYLGVEPREDATPAPAPKNMFSQEELIRMAEEASRRNK